MTLENECRFNKFGYCKFGNYCFRYHENKICQNVKCPVQGCLLRHPRKCRFFLEFGKCKFGTYCKFSHDNIENPKTREKIEVLEKDVELLKLEILDMKNQIEIKEDQLKIIRSEVEEKVGIIEKMGLAINNMENGLKESKKENIILLDKIERIQEINRSLEIQQLKEKKETGVLKDTLAKASEENEALLLQVKQMDKMNEEIDILKDTIAKVSDEKDALTLQVKQNDKEIRKEHEEHHCYKCEFIGKSKEALIEHVKTKHMKKIGQI